MFVVLDLLFVVLSEDLRLPRYHDANLLLFFVIGNSCDRDGRTHVAYIRLERFVVSVYHGKCEAK